MEPHAVDGLAVGEWYVLGSLDAAQRVALDDFLELLVHGLAVVLGDNATDRPDAREQEGSVDDFNLQVEEVLVAHVLRPSVVFQALQQLSERS